MKQVFFLAALALHIQTPLLAQNYADIDQRALNTPPNQAQSIRQLAAFLSRDLQRDDEKARAVFSWLALNVSYVDSTDGTEIWATPDDIIRQRAETVLRNRSAVCQGYANLFQALAREMGLPSEVVTGICKQPDGRIPRIGHAWVCAQVNGNWHLFDPTWGAPPPGAVRWKPVEKYFMADPAQFVLNHLPDDPMWQLLANPVDERRFRADGDDGIAEWVRGTPDRAFDFQDTLRQWLSIDSTRRLEYAADRMIRFSEGNERILFELGRHFYMEFINRYYSLDSLADALIITPGPSPDSLLFMAGVEQCAVYYRKSERYFSQVKSPERRAKISDYHSDSDVKYILQRLRGDYYAALFECEEEALADAATESSLARLHYWQMQSERYYNAVLPLFDCRRMAEHCRSLLHNRSLLRLQMSRRYISWLIQNTEKTAVHAKDKRKSREMISQSREMLQNVLQDVKEMEKQIPVFQYVRDRAEIARQQLFSLRLIEWQQRRQSLMIEAEDIFEKKAFPAKDADQLLENMKLALFQLNNLVDSVQSQRLVIGDQYRSTALANLRQEQFVQQFNIANVQYRLATHEYSEAYDNGTLATQKAGIRQSANAAMSHLKQAAATLDLLEDSQTLTQKNRDQKQESLARLSQAIRGLLDSL